MKTKGLGRWVNPAYDGPPMSSETQSHLESFESELAAGIERFLARVIEHSLAEKWCDADDFLRHFPPSAIMDALEFATDLRSKLLVEAAGVHERIAHKKSTTSAAEDLRIALDEGICDSARILELLPGDERIRYFDHAKLWNFAVEDRFYDGSTADKKRAAERMAFMLEAGLMEDLLRVEDILDGISFDEVARRLPEPELRKIVSQSLTQGRTGIAFSDEHLLESVPLGKLVSYVPGERVWEQVIIAKIAAPAGFVSGEPDEARSDAEVTPKERSVKKETAAAKEEAGVPESKPSRPAAKPPKKSMPPPKPAKRAATQSPKSAPEVAARPVSDAPASAPRSPQEEEARAKVIDRLNTIQRLPPNHETLSTPLLLSIDSMYAELLALASDEDREECIRESFPNAAHLTQAMLALIELLDPSIDITDPVIRDADVDSLIKVVLFEERHRSDDARPSQQPGSALPPPPARPKSSVVPPPPPARGATSVPPPPKRARH